MKKYLLILTILFAVSSCNDDYLEKVPVNEQTEETAFVTYANFETFAWSFYGQFMYTSDYVRGYSQYHTNYLGDYYAGYLATYSLTDNVYRTGNIIPPTTGNGWTYTVIRRANMMLEHIDSSEMSDEDKAHWRAVALFFRSYKYYELVSRFGDVPWITTVIGSDDEDLIYGERTPRKEVADNILADLQEAETLIYEGGNGDNTINRDVVRALMSRFCLFEGTWRKYHGLGDYEEYLNEAVRVSEALMADYPTISDDFDAILNSADLSSHPGMILHYKFETGIVGGYASRFERTTSGIYEMPKYSVERYLCTDGKPITSSDLYEGDLTMYEEFRNRDNRLLMTVVPPYSWKQQCIGGMNPPSFEILPTATYNSLGHFVGKNQDGTEIDQDEYVDLIKTVVPDDTKKRLPVFNWSGTMNWFSPNVLGCGLGPMGSRSGYFVWKYYNLYDDNNYGDNFTDKPLFWIDEVMMNYAEAKFEINEFNQDVADKTINRFRERAGVADMTVSEITSDFDIERDSDVDPVLWEIRRERFAEFIGHGFGWEDIRRWKKGPDHINRVMIGAYINPEDWKAVNDDGTVSTTTPSTWTALSLVDKDFKTSTTGAGYLKRFDNPVNTGGGWNDKYYLYAIPTDEIVLNPNLDQNEGW